MSAQVGQLPRQLVGFMAYMGHAPEGEGAGMGHMAAAGEGVG